MTDPVTAYDLDPPCERINMTNMPGAVPCMPAIWVPEFKGCDG